MWIDKAAAVIAAQLMEPRSERHGLRQLAVGDILELIVENIGEDGVLGRLGDGRLLRLAGLAANLRPGDVVLLRVLAASSKLELGLLNSAAPGAPAAPAPAAPEPAAMRLDQAALWRQMASSAQDAATLALSWRTMVLGHLATQMAVREQGRALQAPGTLAEAGTVPLREAPRALPGLDMASWMFSVYVWAGRRVWLGLLAGEEETAAPRRRHPAGLALRMQLTLPGIGTASLQLRQVTGGVLLDLAADQDATLDALRRALRQMVVAVGRAELRVLRCRLMRVLPDPGQALDIGLAPGASLASALSPALFRAAAELALLLSTAPRAASADGADDADFALFRDLVIR